VSPTRKFRNLSVTSPIYHYTTEPTLKIEWEIGRKCFYQYIKSVINMDSFVNDLCS